MNVSRSMAVLFGCFAAVSGCVAVTVTIACSGPHPSQEVAHPGEVVASSGDGETAPPPPQTPPPETPPGSSPGIPEAGPPAQGTTTPVVGGVEAAPGQVPETGAQPVEPGVQPPEAVVTPAQLYGACRDRVEGVEAAGECTTDADCARAGCSQEVCTTAQTAGTVTTTCEILRCFEVLDTCGCRAGVCSWTLEATVPELKRRPGLDAR